MLVEALPAVVVACALLRVLERLWVLRRLELSGHRFRLESRPWKTVVEWERARGR